MTLAVQFTQVSRQFGEVKAVDRVSIDIKDGEFFSMLGPSGSGKTTCLRLIAGFEQPSAGSIRIHGEEATGLAPYQRDVNTGFQDYALFPHLTVADNIAFGIRNHPRLAQVVGEMLELVNLGALGKRHPHELSGGQQQRVALARALAPEPQLLLLDEPFSNLDGELRRRLSHEVRDILKARGTSAILVTHDQEEALTMSDRIFLMNQGRIVQSGDAETLYTAPVDAFAAGFIGNYNLLEPDDASRLMQRPINSRVAIRPEAIQLSLTGSLEGEVRSHSLLGNVIRYRVEARGVELVVDVLNRSADDLHPNGRRVTLNIETSALCEVA